MRPPCAHGFRSAAAGSGRDARDGAAAGDGSEPAAGGTVPAIYWFDRRLRAWFSAQPGRAPLAIVIAGTGGDGNTSKLATLRAVLYGAGYHVLTVPSPTFPGFIVSASSTGVAGDLKQDSQDLYAAIQMLVAHLPRRTQISEIDLLGYSLGGAHAAMVKSLDDLEHKLRIQRAIMINPPVSLFSSIGRLDELFTLSIGSEIRASSSSTSGFIRAWPTFTGAE